jgi:hypothetical protein
MAPAIREVVVVIACLRRNEALLVYCTRHLPNFPISERARDALWLIGWETMATEPLMWLWDFLFDYRIFVLPDQKDRIRDLTYAAIEAPDDVAIPWLELLRSRGLTFVTVTTIMANLESHRSMDFLAARIESTNVTTIDDGKALEVAGKKGRLDIMRLLLRRGADINHIRQNPSPSYRRDDPREELYRRKAEGTPLHGLAQSDKYFRAVMFLLRNGARTWVVNETGWLPIAKGIRHGAIGCSLTVFLWMLVEWAIPKQKHKK